jgi:tetratricopeptide (TPR) repeat protein
MRRVVVALAVGWLVAVGAERGAHADEVGALVAEGDALAAKGDDAGALRRYVKALVKDPDRLDVYDRATPLWIAAQAWDDAIAWLEKATLRQPRYAGGWYALGYVYRRTGRNAAAVGAYEEYLVLRPKDLDGQFGLAVSLELSDQRDAAIRAYRRYLARERDPKRAAYRAQAREALTRLVPVPATWRASLLAVVTGEATIDVWRVLAEVEGREEGRGF